MYVAEVNAGEPWMPGALTPFAEFSISPGAGVLNYGQGLFEGMKAYRTEADRIVFFRPEENARRMQAGADRLRMPPIPESIFVDAIEQVVHANRHWVPPCGRGALYVRPILFGSGPVLGVAPAPSFTFMIYCTPVGPYFKGGMSAISLIISEDHHRAAPGGSGGVKAIGNYAPGMMPSYAAKAAGYAEVIYLDAETHSPHRGGRRCELLLRQGRGVEHPSLTGTILPGITRASIIELARHRGLEVREERVTAEAAMDADEAFSRGTPRSSPHWLDHPRRANGDLRRRHAWTRDAGPVRPPHRLQAEQEEDLFGWLHEVPDLG